MQKAKTGQGACPCFFRAQIFDTRKPDALADGLVSASPESRAESFDVHQNRVKKSRFVISALIGANAISTAGLALHHASILPAAHYAGILYIYMLGMLVLGKLFLPYPPASYGFDFSDWRRDTLEAVGISTLLILFTIAARIELVKAGFSNFAYRPANGVFDTVLSVVLYLAAAMIQEAVTRGYFQSYFVAIFEKGPANKILAIVLSSVVFAQFHLVYGFAVAGLSFFFSLFLGWLYERRRSILGVSIVHASLGMGMLFFSHF